MKFDFFFVVAVFLNIVFALLFPTTVGLADPFGVDEIRAQKFSELDTSSQQYWTGLDVFNEDGTPGNNFDKIEELNGVGDSDKGVIITALGFGFLDYIKVIFSTLKSLFTFFTAFLVILFKLPSPFNIMIGTPFSLFYVLSLGKFILGR